MMVNSLDGIIADSGRKERRPYLSTRFTRGVENEEADAGRDGRTCIAEPNSQARTDTEEKDVSLVLVTTNKIIGRDDID